MSLNKCPCNKDCKERSADFCPSCEKGKEYKAKNLEEYEARGKAIRFEDYLATKMARSERKMRNFGRGYIK